MPHRHNVICRRRSGYSTFHTRIYSFSPVYVHFEPAANSMCQRNTANPWTSYICSSRMCRYLETAQSSVLQHVYLLITSSRFCRNNLSDERRLEQPLIHVLVMTGVGRTTYRIHRVSCLALCHRHSYLRITWNKNQLSVKCDMCFIIVLVLSASMLRR